MPPILKKNYKRNPRTIVGDYIVEPMIGMSIQEMLYRFSTGALVQGKDNGCHAYHDDDDDDFETIQPGMDRFDAELELREQLTINREKEARKTAAKASKDRKKYEDDLKAAAIAAHISEKQISS